MKISHSAMPRNRSSRSSRSPPTGSEMAGAKAAGAGAASSAIASAAPARGGPAIRSAMDVIWHRSWAVLLGNSLGQVGLTRLHHRKDSIGTRVASKLRRVSLRRVSGPRGRALGRNYVETTIGTGTRWPPPGPGGRLVPSGLFDMMLHDPGKNCPHVPRRYPPDRSHRRAELPAGTLVGRAPSVFLVLPHRHHQHGRGDGATADAALDHYRRLGPQAGGPRRRRGRRTARARAGRALRIYQRRAAADRVGLHVGPLPDGERKRRTFRDRRAGILARQSRQQAGVELGASYLPPPAGRVTWVLSLKVVPANEAGRRIVSILVFGLLASSAVGATAFAQAGSTGGTIAKTNKSISGGAEVEQPRDC